MKRQLLKSILLLFALIAGSGSVWAIDVTATLTGSAWLTDWEARYKDHTNPIYDDMGNGYVGNWFNANAKGNIPYQMIQLGALSATNTSHLSLPKYDGKIKTITLSVTNSSATSKEQSSKKAKVKMHVVNGSAYTKTDVTNNEILVADHSSDETATFSITYDFTTLDTDYDGEGLYICSTSGSLRIWELTVVYEVNTVSASFAANKEWVTYCSPYAIDFSNSITGLEGAYAITSHSAGATTLTATKMTGTVKAGTGLLLHAATVDTENAQVIAIPVAASGDEQTDNMLVGVTSATTVNPTDGTKTNLGLKSGTFVPYSAAGTLAAGKAYLQIPTADMPSNGSKLTIIYDDDETTGIDSIHNSWLSQAAKPSAQFIIHNYTPMFNLSGQKVSESYKGIVIVNGKKYILK